MQELQPQIAELLRTCIYPTSLLLRVAHVELIDVKPNRPERDSTAVTTTLQISDGAHRYATRFLLTDGHLMIQALLHRKLSTLRDAAEVKIGDLLDIKHFKVKQATRTNGRGCVVHLAIEDCHFLKQDSSIPAVHADPETGCKRPRVCFESPIDDPVAALSKIRSIDAEEFIRKVSRSPSKRPRLSNSHKQTNVADEDSSSEGSTLSTGVSGRLSDTQTSLMIQTSMGAGPLSSQRAVSRAQSILQPTMADAASPDWEKNEPSVNVGVRHANEDDEEDEEADFYELVRVDQKLVAQRRQVLRDLDHNVSSPTHFGSPGYTTNALAPNLGAIIAKSSASQSNPSNNVHEEANEITKTPDHDSSPPVVQPPNTIPRVQGTNALSQAANIQPLHNQPRPTSLIQPHPPKTHTQPPDRPPLQSQPPFHTLQSLRNPPPSQQLPPKSYILTTLAFITWSGTTLIHRPGSPFPPKRHLKIVDPSLAATRPPSRDESATRQQSLSKDNTLQFQSQNSFQEAVTVAIYIDAADFKPKAGTLALFRGVVMQRLSNRDIILNAYGRLKEIRFEDDIPLDDTTHGVNGVEEGQKEQHREEHKMDRHWFITDHDKIRALGHGSRLDYYLDWWKARKA